MSAALLHNLFLSPMRHSAHSFMDEAKFGFALFIAELLLELQAFFIQASGRGRVRRASGRPAPYYESNACFALFIAELLMKLQCFLDKVLRHGRGRHASRRPAPYC